jgi:CBS-domain-containing membrane protein
MDEERTSLQPLGMANRSLRKRLRLKDEFVLALLPTSTILGVFFLVDQLSEQRLLFASLASSAFLIYLDPQHGTNSIRTLILSQITAALIGLGTYMGLGPGYVSGAAAMSAIIVFMIITDTVHPPAVSTSLSFALRTGDVSNVVIFAAALAMTAALVILERMALLLLSFYNKKSGQ